MKIGGRFGSGVLAALVGLALSLSLRCSAEFEDNAGFVALQADARKSFKEVVTPFVDTYCSRCHGVNNCRTRYWERGI